MLLVSSLRTFCLALETQRFFFLSFKVLNIKSMIHFNCSVRCGTSVNIFLSNGSEVSLLFYRCVYPIHWDPSIRNSLDYYNCKSWNWIDWLLLPFQNCFILILLPFHTNFRIIPVSTKNLIEILVLLNQYINLGRIDTFTMLDFPIHEYMSLHLFRSWFYWSAFCGFRHTSPLHGVRFTPIMSLFSLWC